MPEGAELVRSAKVPWPTVICENVIVLPGVPSIYEMKLRALRDRFDDGIRFWNHTVYTQCDEGSIAGLLTGLTVDHPAVEIGSYLVFDEPDYRVRLTFDSTDPDASRAASNAFIAGIPSEQFVRRESTEDANEG